MDRTTVTSPLLGVLIASAPGEGDPPLLEALCRGALLAGWQVEIFLMDDGIGYAGQPALRGLIELGVEACACAMDAEARGVSGPALEAAGVRAGSQHDHARLVRDSRRFLAFT